jgi:hypothetical protein
MTPEVLLEYRKQWGSIFDVEIDGIEFIWRPLTRKEYKDICSLDITDGDKEELICKICVLEPAGFDFLEDEGLAGIPSKLSDLILDSSCITPESIRSMLKAYRASVGSFEVQMDLVIFEGFNGKYSLEEIKNWPMEKAVAMFAQAEWILTTLKGVPLSIEDEQNDIPPELRKPDDV